MILEYTQRNAGYIIAFDTIFKKQTKQRQKSILYIKNYNYCNCENTHIRSRKKIYILWNEKTIPSHCPIRVSEFLKNNIYI